MQLTTLSAFLAGLAVVGALPAPSDSKLITIPKHIGIPMLRTGPSKNTKRGIWDADHPPFLENKYQRLYRAKEGEVAVRAVPVRHEKRDGATSTVYETQVVTVVPQPAAETGHILNMSDFAPILGGSEPTQPAAAPTTSAAPAVTPATTSTVTPAQAATTFVSQVQQVASSAASAVPLSGSPMPSLSFAAARSTPTVRSANLLGNCDYAPDMSYLPHTNEPIETLPANMLSTTPSAQLSSSSYPIYNGSGTLDIPAGTPAMAFQSLDYKPTLSRDNGKGGYLNGYHLWVFADTGVLTPDGQFAGFVSSSVAVDTGMHALDGKPVTLRDMAGEWDGASGVVRGFAPFTQGEMGYTNAMAGSAGARYAIWAESAIIPHSNTEALFFAPVVYINEHANPMYTSMGMTLMTVNVDNPVSGPIATRVANKLFDDSTIEWGGIAAIRSWGPSGPGGSDGRVYTIGNTEGGLMIARCDAADVADGTKYEFYDAATKTWGGYATRAQRNVDNTAHAFVQGAYATADIFYSPHHLTWIMVFETPYADNKFYVRYLTPKDGKPVYPNYTPQGQDQAEDYVEAIIDGTWSDPVVLFSCPTPPSGSFVYGGGVHQGYFGADDITNGGSKMLLSWTAPTGNDATSVTNGYDQVTAVIEFD